MSVCTTAARLVGGGARVARCLPSVRRGHEEGPGARACECFRPGCGVMQYYVIGRGGARDRVRVRCGGMTLRDDVQRCGSRSGPYGYGAGISGDGHVMVTVMVESGGACVRVCDVGGVCIGRVRERAERVVQAWHSGVGVKKRNMTVKKSVSHAARTDTTDVKRATHGRCAV